MIKITNKNVIDLQDWDKLVEETYGRPYSLQQQDGCMERGNVEIIVPNPGASEYDYENDNIPDEVNGDEMGVSFKAWLARDPKEWAHQSPLPWELSLFWHRNFYPSLEMVANDLHEKGLLPAGEYTIEIDW